MAKELESGLEKFYLSDGEKKARFDALRNRSRKSGNEMNYSSVLTLSSHEEIYLYSNSSLINTFQKVFSDFFFWCFGLMLASKNDFKSCLHFLVLLLLLGNVPKCLMRIFLTAFKRLVLFIL